MERFHAETAKSDFVGNTRRDRKVFFRNGAIAQLGERPDWIGMISG